MNALQKPHHFFYRNGLSIVLLSMMLIFWALQFYTGYKEYNKENIKQGSPPVAASAYIVSGHFISTTLENWESEFLQMFLYVLLTIKLRQQGSSESKKLQGEKGSDEEPVDKKPKPGPGAPFPVRKGGWLLKLYSNSLSIAFGILFLLSFLLHFYGSLQEENEQRQREQKPPVHFTAYITETKFWFESFQNWQSEFLAVAAIVLLSIWLRQYGSPESKPVDAPYRQTGT